MPGVTRILTRSPCVACATAAHFSSMLLAVAGRRSSASSSGLRRSSFPLLVCLLATTPWYPPASCHRPRMAHEAGLPRDSALARLRYSGCVAPPQDEDERNSVVEQALIVIN